MAMPFKVNRSVSMDDAEREFWCRLVCLLVCLYYLRRLQHRATIAGCRRNFLLRALKTVSTLDEEDVTRQIRTLIMYLADLPEVPAHQVPGLTNEECPADSHQCTPLAISPAVDVEEESETVAATETPSLWAGSSVDIQPSLSPQSHGTDEKCLEGSYHSKLVSATVDVEEESETVSSTDSPTLCLEESVDTTEPSYVPQRHAAEETCLRGSHQCTPLAVSPAVDVEEESETVAATETPTLWTGSSEDIQPSLSPQRHGTDEKQSHGGLRARSAKCRTTDPLELPTALETTGPRILRAAAFIRVIRSWSAQHHRVAVEEYRRFSPSWTTPAAWHRTRVPPRPTDRSDPPLRRPALASTSSMAAAGAWSRTARPSRNTIGYAWVVRRIPLLGASPRVLRAAPCSINMEGASSTPEAADPSTRSPGAVVDSTVRHWLVQNPRGGTFAPFLGANPRVLRADPCSINMDGASSTPEAADPSTGSPGFVADSTVHLWLVQNSLGGTFASLLAAPPPLPWIFSTVDTREADCQTRPSNGLDWQTNGARCVVVEWEPFSGAIPRVVTAVSPSIDMEEAALSTPEVANLSVTSRGAVMDSTVLLWFTEDPPGSSFRVADYAWIALDRCTGIYVLTQSGMVFATEDGLLLLL